MLTFISGWRSPDRDKALVNLRDKARSTIFFIDDASRLPTQFPDAPVTDLWRNGLVDFRMDRETAIQLVRINYDTDNELVVRAVSRALMQGADAQIVIMFDAVDALYRLYPALRAAGAVLASDARLDAAEGDHVIFTRGGSFLWTDHLLESQTATLIGDETLDVGVISEDIESVNLPAADHRW
ncbi:MAG: hypothetical protein ACYDBJ_06255 [Aggregatilineales bacterium]